MFIFTLAAFPAVLGVLSSFVCCYNEYIRLYSCLSKQPAAIYCPLLNDKILSKKEMWQSSQHGSWLLEFDERFSWIGWDSEAIIFFSRYRWGFTFFCSYIQIVEKKHQPISVSCWSKSSPWKWLTDWLGWYWPARLRACSTPWWLHSHLAVATPSMTKQV